MTTSPVLTSAEAVRWLRLDEDHDDIGPAVLALKRLVQDGKLRPLRGVGRTYKYTLDELQRFIRDEFEPFDPPDQLFEHHLQLEASEWCTETEVGAVAAKRHVIVWTAFDVEPIRVVEYRLVAIG